MGEHNVWVNIKEKSRDWIYLTDLIWTTSGWCHAGSVWYFNSLTQGMYKHVPIWQRSFETDHHRSYVGSGSPKTDVDKKYYHLSPVFLFPSLQVLLLLSESTTWQQGFLKNNKTKKKLPLRRSPHIISNLRLFFERERYESFHEEGKGWAVVISEWINGSRIASRSQLCLGLSATSWMHAWLTIYV